MGSSRMQEWVLLVQDKKGKLAAGRGSIVEQWVEHKGFIYGGRHQVRRHLLGVVWKGRNRTEQGPFPARVNQAALI